MREIKFRLWDKCNERMVEPRNILKICMSRLNQEPYLIVYLRKWMNPNREIGGIDKCYTNEFELMQYTGIKDKKDNEIYEGDICKWTSTDTDGTTLTVYSIIVFEDGSFWAKDYEGRSRETIYECINYNSEYEYVELAGNIYENPELLEVK